MTGRIGLGNLDRFAFVLPDDVLIDFQPEERAFRSYFVQMAGFLAAFQRFILENAFHIQHT